MEISKTGFDIRPSVEARYRRFTVDGEERGLRTSKRALQRRLRYACLGEQDGLLREIIPASIFLDMICEDASARRTRRAKVMLKW